MTLHHLWSTFTFVGLSLRYKKTWHLGVCSPFDIFGIPKRYTCFVIDINCIVMHDFCQFSNGFNAKMQYSIWRKIGFEPLQYFYFPMLSPTNVCCAWPKIGLAKTREFFANWNQFRKQFFITDEKDLACVCIRTSHQ